MQFGPPTVSICCIAYNHAAFIEKALAGFLMQEVDFTVEIIIHDDCSTDGTADIIRRFQREHPERITAIFQTENQHRLGRKIFPLVFERARGKYIAICEGDDHWIDPAKLRKQVAFLETSPDCAGCFHSVWKETHRPDGSTVREKSALPTAFVQIHNLLLCNPIHTCSVLIRRDCLPVSLPPRFDKCAMGDWPRWILAATRGRWAYLSETMAVYVIHEQGVWSRLPLLEQQRRMIYMLACMCEEIDATHLPAAHRGLLHHAKELALTASETGDDSALEWLTNTLAQQRPKISAPLLKNFETELGRTLATRYVQMLPAIASREAIDRIHAVLTRLRDGQSVPPRQSRAIRAQVARELQNRGHQEYESGNHRAARRSYAQAVVAAPPNLRALLYWWFGLIRPLHALVRHLSARGVQHS